MQAKPNQRKYYCPGCSKKLKRESQSQFGQEVHLIYCTNEDCDFDGVSWDIKKLESYEINQIQRVEELIDVD